MAKNLMGFYSSILVLAHRDPRILLAKAAGGCLPGSDSSFWGACVRMCMCVCLNEE